MSKKKTSEPCGILGVSYTKDWVKKIDGSWPALVGSFAKVNTLHMPDTRTFDSIALAKESPMRTWVNQYLEAREKEFGHPSKAPKTLRGNWVDKILNEKVCREVLEDASPPKIGINDVTADALAAMSTLWYAVKCMKAVPRLCEKSKVEDTPLSLDPYDVLHMCIFLANCHRSFKGRNIDAEILNKRNQNRILPVYVEARPTNHSASASASASALLSISPGQSSSSGDLDALRRSLLGMEAYSPFEDYANLQALGPNAPSANEKAVAELMNSIQRALIRPRPGPQPAMSDDVYRVLHNYFVDEDRDFSKDCVLFEPIDTQPRQTSLDTHVALVASIGEAIMTANDEGDDHEAANNMDLADDVGCAVVERRDYTMSARTREFQDACNKAGLTVTKDGVYLHSHRISKPVSLEPWQATAVAWMMDMEEQSPLHGGILADGCGLGKTRTTYTLMERSLTKTSENGTYYPQLVLCPKSLLDMWYAEAMEHFGDTFVIKVFYGPQPKSPKTHREECVINNNDVLMEYLRTLDSSSIETLRVVIISTYDTFAFRTTHQSGGRGVDPVHLESDDENDPENSHSEVHLTSSAGNDDECLDLDVIDTIEETESTDDPRSILSDQRPAQSVRYALGSQGSKTTASAIQGLGVVQSDNMSTAINYVSRLKAFKFSRIICDEAHRVKNILSKQHQSISLLEYDAIWFLTATPMSNSFTDLNGPLSLLHKRSSADGEEEEEEVDLPLAPGMRHRSGGGADYLIDVYGAWSRLPKLPTPAPWGLLNPKLLVDLQSRRLTPGQACKLIPIIFRLCILQRQMGDDIEMPAGEKIQIGGKIPPARVMTVELCYSDAEQREHDLLYSKIIKGLVKKENDSSPETFSDAQLNGKGRAHNGKFRSATLSEAQLFGRGRVNSGKLRRLCALAFHAKLDTFLNLEGISNQYTEHVADIAKEGNMCFELFWQLTVEGKINPPPRIRFDRARYLLCQSPRLKYLLKIFLAEGLTPSSAKPRFVIFCNWPMTVWLVQMLLHALSLEFAAITSPMSVADRTEAINRFNDSNNDCSVFITTYTLGAFGLNLQSNCSRLVLMESAINYNRVFHAIGRMHRLGQKEPQKIWYLFQDSTIQRWMEWRNLTKLRGQIAAQNREAFEPVLRHRQENRAREGVSINEKDERDGDIEDLCDRFFRDLMGQEEGCGDRSGMGNEMELDVVAKDTRYHSRRHGQGINNMTRHVVIEEQKEQQEEKEPEDLTETRKRPRGPEDNGEGPSTKRVFSL
ncbi:SNF2-related protein [Penicillium longicatenatum]|uniref:SNF2-related protein n=1 Tax=Penicillium longicatenatum TaxID=1561947 RepID=UPI002548CB7D|nr:SNF2-related protein [Penicillium longicatenatum]KAJ5649628.1 SNF2-related protein [Penicillium longicatenatum]